MKVGVGLGLIAVLASCQGDVPKPEAAPLPQSMCDEAEAAVKQLTQSGAVILSSPLEAAMAQESWLALPEDQRESLTRAMGMAATCAGGVPKLEQEVTIRSETGMVLTRRVVRTSVSLPGSG
jgi:hypothetical protein